MASSHQRHLRIQAFKSSRTAVIDGINFANVVATMLYETSFKGWLKRAVYALLMGAFSSTEGEDSRSHVLLYSAREKGRADYDYIADSLARLMGPRARLVEVHDRFSVLQPFKTLAGLISCWPLIRGYNETAAQRLLCALLVAKARSALLPVALRVTGGAGTLVTFCDAHPMENLATQLSASMGLATITNQHGQYRILDHRNMSADAEAYANFQSDRMLAWGRATVREFEKAGIAPSRLSIIGWIRAPRSAEPQVATDAACFGVMLNGENARESNLNLLRAAEEIAARLDVGYVVRLHPWSRADDYSAVTGARCIGMLHLSLADYLGRVRFSLGHMSGAVVEVLDAGSPVYLLDDGCLASVFQLEGLSWPDVASIQVAIEKDMADANETRRRLGVLARWFNDADEQVDRITSALGIDAAPAMKAEHVVR